MRPSPLIIENYFVKRVQFELKPGFDRLNSTINEDIEPNIHVNLETEKYSGDSGDKDTWRFELSVDSDDITSESEFPFTFGITIVGLFQVDENYPAEKADLLAEVNAPSVLYSSAREILINLTGRSSFSPILLPSISFVPSPEPEAPKEKKRKSTNQSRKKKS